MLMENIMYDCLFKFLRVKDEVSLECVCWFFLIIGKDLDIDEVRVWIVFYN